MIHGNLINACKIMLKDFGFVKVTYVKRRNNETAHVLVEQSLSLEGS